MDEDVELPGPAKRWGHTCVEALNRMFIIGGYCGKYKLNLAFICHVNSHKFVYSDKNYAYSVLNRSLAYLSA